MAHFLALVALQLVGIADPDPQFLELTGPDHQLVEINVSEIVSIRAPRRGDHFAPGSKCLVFTTDGKYLAVVESCRQIGISIKADQKH